MSLKESTIWTPTSFPTDQITEILVTNASGTYTGGAAIRESFAILVPLLLLVLTTIGGNIVVMICVRIDQRLRTMSSMYVFSLAGADAVVGLLVMSGMCVYTVFGFWPLGAPMCTFWVTMDFVCCTVSMFHLCLISYDRYEAVLHPVRYKQNRTALNVAIRIVAAWILGVLVWMPAIVSFRAVEPGPLNDCFFIPDRRYILIQSLVVYYGPIIIMVVFYMMCLNALRLRYLRTAAAPGTGGQKLFLVMEGSTTATVPTGKATTNTSAGPDDTNHSNDHPAQTTTPKEETATTGNKDELPAVSQAKLTKQQQQLRSIRTLGVVMGVFLFCWLPFCLFWPIAAYCPYCIPMRAYEYSYWAAYLNSAINPFLYFLSNRDFRSAFMKLIGRGKRE